VAAFAWLFGIVTEQPLEYRRLLRLRRNIYTRVATLDAEVLRSAEPIAFDELDPSAFEPIRAGAAWGGVFDCAWLRIRGEVPAGVENPVMLLGIGGEGLVHAADGEILDSVSTVWQQADLPHSAGRFRPVRGVDTSSGRVDVLADVTYNGFLIYQTGHGRFRGAYLATRDDERFALYYDYLALVVLAGATEDAALATELRAALRDAWARFRRDDIAGARAALAGSLAAPSTSDFTYRAIGHGHLDMAWLWPLRETRRKAARTYTRAVNTTIEHPGYIYGTSQPQQLQWMKQQHPALFEKVKTSVAEGRIELQGSFWVETDTNMPGGESLVRQALVGRRFLREEFGRTPEQLRLCWLPDTFGYSGNLPQILSKSGMDWFMTIKLAWNKVNTFPYRTFTWEGIDGSSVLVHMPPEGDYNSRGAADGLLKGIRHYPEKALEQALLVFGSGDGGGGPGEIHLEVTGREHDLRGLPRVLYSPAAAFFERLEQQRIEHRHAGELYLEAHQGTYTTQADIKKHNRISERKLHNAEALAALVGDDSRARLEQPWRDLLLNHFHDILPGSAIARVVREAVESFARIEDAADAYAAELLPRLPRGDEATAGLLNLTGVPRREHVRLGERWLLAESEPYAAASMHEVPPTPELGFTSDTMTNGLLSLRFGASGEIVSCVDEAGVQHSAGGLNRLVLHRDRYQWPWDAWDIDPTVATRTPRTLRPSEVETTIDGPTVIRRQFFRDRRFTVEQRVVLEAGSDTVRFDTTVDWHEKHRMLRAEFRPTHHGDSADSEIQFGHISRPMTENGPVETAQFEICAHKWIATQNDAGGFALLNDAKFGHRAKNGLLSLSILRAPTFPDKTADRGIHHFGYAFCPFPVGEGAAGLTKVIREGYRLNNPLIAADGAALESAVTLDHPAIIVETIKPAESGSGIVLRLYESLGKPAEAALRTTLTHTAAIETDLMENPLGTIDLGRLAFGPFEIKTILLEARR
jgi:alpha-mannosidase